MITTTTLLVLGSLSIIVVVVLAIFFYLLGASRGNRSKNKTSALSDPNLLEVVRLMRDTDTQELVVQMDGQSSKGAGELSPEQQRRLKITSGMLVNWLGQPAPASSGEGQAVAETDVAEMHTPQVMLVTGEPLQELKPVSTEIPDLVGSLLNPTPAPVPVFRSIAMQVNDILQARMAGTPFAKRGISVNESPDRGVLVMLDGQKYSGVDDVPDEKVRQLIHSAVAEWEELSKSGTK